MNPSDNERPLFALPSTLTRRNRPTSSSSHAVLQHGVHVTGGPEVFIYRDVLDELMFHACYTQLSSATLLTGQVSLDGDGPFIEVRGFIEATSLADPLEWLTSLNRRFDRVLNQFQRTAGGMILGWSYARYGGAACVDKSALLVHSTFFNLSHQIFLALDPGGEALGLYQRDTTGELRNTGFSAYGKRAQSAVTAPQDVGEEPQDAEFLLASGAGSSRDVNSSELDEGFADDLKQSAADLDERVLGKDGPGLPSVGVSDNATPSVPERDDETLQLLDDVELLSAIENALSGFGNDQTFETSHNRGTEESKDDGST